MNEIDEICKSLVDKAKGEGVTRYVVGGVVSKEGKALLLRRSKNDFMGGIYELPSGKVENNETLPQALCREILEETGMKVLKIKKHLGNFDYLSKKGENTRQFNFEVTVEDSNIKLSEHDAFAWVNKAEKNNYNITDNVNAVLNEFWG
ncbi:MAG: NUDIX domain-containing protein [Candidatus Micrarchaeota archaeon]|nr:NUDIX domain-containing protein [Candidatus Micrarchaeota archaeon]